MGRSKFNTNEALNMNNRPKRKRISSNVDGWNDPFLPGDGIDSEEKRGLFHCNYCQKDITDNVRIKCTKCTDFDLCLDCFSVGAELRPHQANHPYHVMESLGFPLFQPNWNADEEILLLEGIEMFGLGNWNDIANHVGKKSKNECYDHYKSVYINSPFSPLPDMSPLKGKNKSELIFMVKNANAMKAGSIENITDEAAQSFSSRQDDLNIDSNENENATLLSVDSTLNSNIGSSGKEKDEILQTVKEELSDDGKSSNSKSASLSIADSAFRDSISLKKATAVTPHDVHDGHNAHADTMDNHAMPSLTSQPQTEGAGDTTHSVRTLGRQNHGRSEEGGGGRGRGGGGGGEGECRNGYDIAGYNPKRNEFDPDFDEDAENLVTDMEFKEGDIEEDRILKIKILNIYRSRVEERKRRKKFILERGLMSKAHQFIHGRSHSEEDKIKDRDKDKEKGEDKEKEKEKDEKEEKGSEKEKEEREIYEQFKVFARFLNQNEFDSLLSSLYSEKRLRKQIKNLKEYRQSGCRLWSDVDRFKMIIKKEKDNGEHSIEQDPLLHPYPHPHLLNPSLPPLHQQDDKLIDIGLQAEDLKRKETNSMVKRRKQVKEEDMGVDVKEENKSSVVSMVDDLVLENEVMDSEFDIFLHPGADLLSSKERELSTQNRLLPFQYLKVKEVMLMDSMRNGSIDKQEMASSFHISQTKINAVFEYLMSKGWLKPLDI